MARELTAIYDEIVASKETKSALNGLLPNPETSEQFTDAIESGSKVAVWRLQYWIIAFAIWSFEKIMDIHLETTTQLINERLSPSLPWYQFMAFEFQYGDSLAYLDGRYQYPTVNPANRIIAQCAVTEASRGLSVKVAKDPGTGLEKLSAAELESFDQYLKKRKAPGTVITLISEDPDLLKLDIGVIVDTQLINLSGELVADTSVRPVDAAINNFLANFTQNDFNGFFRIQKLVDAIQAVNGVIDVDPRSLQYKYGSLDYTEIDVYVQPFAGYLKIDPAYPLTNVIEYLAS